MKTLALLTPLLSALASGCRENESPDTMKCDKESALSTQLTFKHSTEHAGFMAVIDLGTYKVDVSKEREKFFQELTNQVRLGVSKAPDTFFQEFIKQVRLERAFAWGCPEQDFAVKVTVKPPAEPSAAVQSAVGYLTTSGRVCLTSYDHLAFCAEYPQFKLPQLEASRFSDRVCTVKPGRYKITVEQQFKWTPGDQFSMPLNESVKNYVIHIEPAGAAPTNSSGVIPFYSR